MDISFQIDRGEIIATIGADGAGKSTALKAVSRLLGAFSGQITEGEVFLEGKSIKNLRTDELAYLGMAIVPDRINLREIRRNQPKWHQHSAR